MSAPNDSPILPSNAELARIFHEIGDMLEIRGELVFQTVAYHRAADAIAHSALDVAAAYREGNPPRIAGVGAAIAAKIDELVRTGHMAFYERLRAEVPPGLVALLEIPGVGPKTVRQLHEELGVESLEDLRRAAESGALRGLRGMSERTEQQVMAGIAQLESRPPERLRLGQAESIIEALIDELSGAAGLQSIVPAGSFRRRRETVGDIDLLAETTDPGSLVERFVSLPSVESVIAKGPHKAAVRLTRGPDVDLMVMPPGRAGTFLIHFTGSKEHNVRLRGLLRQIGFLARCAVVN